MNLGAYRQSSGEVACKSVPFPSAGLVLVFALLVFGADSTSSVGGRFC